MTVYTIVQLQINDRECYDRYQSKFWDIFKKYKGELLVSDEEPEVLEGQWTKDKIVLISFPDKAAFIEWAASAEYLEISRDRKAGAQAVILLAKGFSLKPQ